MALVTRRGWGVGGGGVEEVVESPGCFFFRFFLRSPLPRERVVECLE